MVEQPPVLTAGVPTRFVDAQSAFKRFLSVCMQVKLLVVCAGYQKLDSLQDLDFEELDKNWQVKLPAE